MKLRGKRQSTNVEDVTAKSISIAWLLEGGFVFPPKALVIDTDGMTYGSVDPRHLDIYLLPSQPRSILEPNEEWLPTLTTGQANAIRRIIGVLPPLFKKTLKVRPPTKQADVPLVKLVTLLLQI